MNHPLLAVLALPLLPGLGASQVLPDDILVNSVVGSAIYQIRPDGTLVQMAGPASGSVFEGASLTAGGRWLSTYRMPADGFSLFDPVTGLEVATHVAPEIGFVPGDTGVLSDGTLVIVDQAGELELYTEDGTHQGTLLSNNLEWPFGLHVDASDELWVADVGAPYSGGGRIVRADRFGNLLDAFDTVFEPGDLVRDKDGSLWVTARMAKEVFHLTSAGTVISSFTAPVQDDQEFEAIGLASDGTLFLTSFLSTSIFRFDRQGHLLATLPSPPQVRAFFLTVVPGDPPGTAACFGDGSGAPCGCGNEVPGPIGGCRNGLGRSARLSAIGSPDTTADSLVLTVSNVTAQPGLFFQGNGLIGGGAGQTFGDGVRCCGQGILRLQVVSPPGPAPTTATSSIDVSAHPGQTGLQGSTRCYQYWYRDPMNSPCGAGFNLSNALSVTWL